MFTAITTTRRTMCYQEQKTRKQETRNAASSLSMQRSTVVTLDSETSNKEIEHSASSKSENSNGIVTTSPKKVFSKSASEIFEDHQNAIDCMKNILVDSKKYRNAAPCIPNIILQIQSNWKDKEISADQVNQYVQEIKSFLKEELDIDLDKKEDCPIIEEDIIKFLSAIFFFAQHRNCVSRWTNSKKLTNSIRNILKDYSYLYTDEFKGFFTLGSKKKIIKDGFAEIKISHGYLCKTYEVKHFLYTQGKLYSEIFKNMNYYKDLKVSDESVSEHDNQIFHERSSKGNLLNEFESVAIETENKNKNNSILPPLERMPISELSQAFEESVQG